MEFVTAVSLMPLTWFVPLRVTIGSLTQFVPTSSSRPATRSPTILAKVRRVTNAAPDDGSRETGAKTFPLGSNRPRQVRDWDETHGHDTWGSSFPIGIGRRDERTNLESHE